MYWLKNIIVVIVVLRCELSSVQVVSLSCDGASTNRGFFKMHKKTDNIKHGVVYRTRNIYAPDGRYIYFFSDVPHLMKTSRNCWLGSHTDGSCRYTIQLLYACMYVIEYHRSQQQGASTALLPPSYGTHRETERAFCGHIYTSSSKPHTMTLACTQLS